MRKMRCPVYFRTFGLLMATALLVNACGGLRPYATGPIKTFDPDNRPIPEPPESEECFMWESIYVSTFRQLEKPLDLGSTFQSIGNLLGLENRDEAQNVNVLDEVAESSWYTYRHYFEPMSLEELRRGPVVADEAPDTSGAFLITKGKSEGATPGFFMKDRRGSTFIVKVDMKAFPELQSSSEVISTNVFYAAGYFVPQNSIAYIHPDSLAIAEDATITVEGEKRRMTRRDLQHILDQAYIRGDGKLRVMASKFLGGKPLGPWKFWGTDRNDPNDRIPHEDRRELRGLRVLSSWLKDVDRRNGNTMAVYVKKGDSGYVSHYLLDMGMTLGTGDVSYESRKKGNEYQYDPRYMGLQYGTLGLNVKPWERPGLADRPLYPAVGYFQSEIFSPGKWVPRYPVPAFEKATPRDGFWGAKLVMSFSDAHVRALVESGRISDPDAVDYLTKILVDRRDKIGRYWFSKVNPLDEFEVERDEDTLVLSFKDLAVTGGLVLPEQHRYAYRVTSNGKVLVQNRITEHSELRFEPEDRPRLTVMSSIYRVAIHTLSKGRADRGKRVDVYIEVKNQKCRVVGIKRET